MKILFVTPRYPYPLLSGDRVRAFHQLTTLAKSHETFLLCPPPPFPEAEEHLKHLVAHRTYIAPSRIRTAARIASGAFKPTPLQTLACSDRAYRHEALALIRRYGIDMGHVQLVRMAPVLQGARLPRFMDFVDALSVNMAQLATRSKGPKRLAAEVESRRLHRYEQLMIEEYDAGGITSGRDRKAIGDPEKLFVIPQGVPLHGGCPETHSRPEARIIFTGRMSYFPNEDAACWFANEVFPLVRRQMPRAEFVVAGADPGPRVKALADQPGVSILGYVNSITEELLGSTVAIVPMRCGTGMQTKIVEAMAAGTPLVITSEGLGSLNLRNGIHVSLADGVEPFARAVLHLLNDRDAAVAQATHARREVESNYSWMASTSELLKGYEYAQDAFAKRSHGL